MSDLGWALIWIAVLGASLGGCLWLRGLGLASTYIRDLLHVGAGVWIVGWPWWQGDVIPVGLVAGVALGTALVPALATHVGVAARLQRSVAEGDERFAGLIHYTLAYALLTAVGLTVDPFPAAAALLSLSLGDGIGGAVGRAFGRHRYRLPWGKSKSLEGTLAVAVMAGAGALLAAARFDVAVAAPTVLAVALVAAIAEGAAPRSTDNLLVPGAVWLTVEVLS